MAMADLNKARADHRVRNIRIEAGRVEINGKFGNWIVEARDEGTGEQRYAEGDQLDAVVAAAVFNLIHDAETW